MGLWQNLIGITILFLVYGCNQPSSSTDCKCPPIATSSPQASPIPTIPPVSSPTPTPANKSLPFFLIGADSVSEDTMWACPKASETTLDKLSIEQLANCQMAKWKLRGINTIVRAPISHDLNKWEYNAVQNGLKVIRLPQADLAADAKDPNLLAWEQGDEPDLHGTDPGLLLSQYQQFKKAAPDKFVFLNISGGEFMGKRSSHPYDQYFNASDVIGHDIYPVTGWNMPDWIDLTKNPPQRWNAGTVIDAMARLPFGSGKPQLAYIETSNQGLNWVPNERGVTVDEFRGEIWDAVIHGASGIIYFPEVITPWNFDGTPADVSAELVKQNGILAKLSTTLLSPGKSLTEKIPFEAAERNDQGHLYRFILNFSHAPAIYSGSSAPQSAYGPYEVKIYRDGALFTP